jgi:hypothetical protein
MERKTIGLLGAIAGLAATAPLHAATAEPAPLPAAGSYAELLAPVAEPGAILRAHDALLAREETEVPAAHLVRVDHHHHHYHHHHDHAYRRYYYHHHHHHHHHGYYGYYGWYYRPGGYYRSGW